MKIKNKSVIIKSGKKTYELHNLILDEYLKRFVMTQTDPSYWNFMTNLSLDYAYLKFDSPIDFDEKSEIDGSNFDIALLNSGNVQFKQALSPQKIEVTYQYDYVIFDYSAPTSFPDGSQYYGRKIATIGFDSWYRNTNACSMIDVTNYNIYFDENFSITRGDIITSDAMFYSPFSNILGPVHLAPYRNDPIIEGSDNRAFSIIYSVGLSSYTDRMDVEFILGENIDWEVDEDNAQIIIYDLQNKEEHSLLQANPLLYCNNQLMPVMVEGGQQYKYIIVKYKLWETYYTDDGSYYVDTDEWYYQAIPIDETNMLTLRIKYERG